MIPVCVSSTANGLTGQKRTAVKLIPTTLVLCLHLYSGVLHVSKFYIWLWNLCGNCVFINSHSFMSCFRSIISLSDLSETDLLLTPTAKHWPRCICPHKIHHGKLSSGIHVIRPVQWNWCRVIIASEYMWVWYNYKCAGDVLLDLHVPRRLKMIRLLRGLPSWRKQA